MEGLDEVFQDIDSIPDYGDMASRIPAQPQPAATPKPKKQYSAPTQTVVPPPPPDIPTQLDPRLLNQQEQPPGAIVVPPPGIIEGGDVPPPPPMQKFDLGQPPLVQAEEPQQQQPITETDLGLDDDFLNKASEDLGKADRIDKGAVKPEYDMIQEMYKGALAAFKHHAQAFEAGGRSVRHGMIWADYMEGKISKEEAQRLTQLTPEQTKIEDELAKLSPLDIRNWGLLAAQSAPFMGTVIQGGVEGAVTIAPVGGAIGLAGGPTSPITVPAGLWGGAVLGFNSGGFLTSRKIMAGQAFKTFTDAGIPEEAAKHGAIFAGGVMALIENLQLRQISKTAGEAVDNWMKTAAGKNTLRQLFFGMAENAGVQGAEELAQQAVQDFTQIGVAKYTDHPEAIPKPEEMLANWAQQFIAGAGVGTIFHVGAKGVGATTGAGIKAALKTFDDKFESNKAGLLSELKARQEFLDLQDTAKAQELQRVKEVQAEIYNPNQDQTIKADLSMKPAEEVLAQPLSLEDATKQLDDLRDQQKDLNKNADLITTPEEEQAYKDSKRSLTKQIREAKAQKREAELREKLQEARDQLASTGDPKLQKRIDSIQEDIVDAKREAITKELDASVSETESDYNNAVIKLKEHQDNTVTKIGKLNEKIDALETEIDSNPDDPGIDTKYEQADKLITQREKLQNSLTDSVHSRRVAKLETSLKDLRDLKDIIGSNDELATEILNQQRTQIASGKVDNIGRKAIQNLLSAVKESDRSVEQNRKLYDRIARLALPKAADRKGLPSAGKLKTPEQLNAAVDKLLAKTGAIYEKQARDESMADLQKHLERGKPKGKGRSKKSVLDKETNAQKVVSKINTLVNMKDKDRKAYLQDVEDRYIAAVKDKTKMTDDLETEYQIASLVGDISAKESSEIADLANTVRSIVAESRESEIERALAEKEETNKFLDEAVSAVDDPSNLVPGREPAPFTGSVKDHVKQLGRSVFSWAGKWHTVFQKANKDTRDRLVKRLDIYPIVENIRTLKRLNTKSVFNEISKTTGLSFEKAIDYSVQATNDLVSFDYDKGTFKGTRAELMQFVAWARVAKLRKGLEEGNGFTFDGKDSWLSKANAALTQTDQNVIEGLENHYKKQAPLLSKAFKQLTGLDLEIEEFYGGRAQRTRVSEDASVSEFDQFELDLSSSAKRQFKIGQPGSVIARTDSKLALRSTDIFTNALQSATINAHYVAWAPHLKFINRVMSDARLTEAIKRNFGSGLKDSLDLHLKSTIHGETEVGTWATGIISTVMRNAWTLLAAKPLSYLKQYTSVVNIARKVPIRDFIEGFVDYYKNSTSHANKIIESTNFWENRYDDFDSTIAGIIMSKDRTGMKEAKIKKTLLFSMLSGDKEVTRVGWWIAYKSALKSGSDTEDAITFANKAIDTTQSTSNMAELSDVARNSYARALTAFGQQPTRLFEDEVTAWRDAFNDKTPKSVVNAVGISVLNRLSQVMFMGVGAAWAMALAHDDKERDEIIGDLVSAAIAGSVPPALGDLISTVVDIGHGQLPRKYSILPLQAIIGSGEFLHSVNKHLAAGDLDKHWGALVYQYARSINLLAGGIPIIEPIGREIKRKEVGQSSLLDIVGGN